MKKIRVDEGVGAVRVNRQKNKSQIGTDRKSVVEGKSVFASVDLCGRPIHTKQHIRT